MECITVFAVLVASVAYKQAFCRPYRRWPEPVPQPVPKPKLTVSPSMAATRRMPVKPVAK